MQRTQMCTTCHKHVLRPLATSDPRDAENLYCHVEQTIMRGTVWALKSWISEAHVCVDAFPCLRVTHSVRWRFQQTVAWCVKRDTLKTYRFLINTVKGSRPSQEDGTCQPRARLEHTPTHRIDTFGVCSKLFQRGESGDTLKQHWANAKKVPNRRGQSHIWAATWFKQILTEMRSPLATSLRDIDVLSEKCDAWTLWKSTRQA